MPEKKISTDKRIFYKINVAQRLLLKYSDKEIRKQLAVSTAQIAALFHLLNNDGCMFKDLSRVLSQNKSATTTLVERMKKNGLIIKKKSLLDGRASHIFITGKGKKTIQKARPLVNELNRRMLKQFTDDEIKVVHYFLDTIIKDFG